MPRDLAKPKALTPEIQQKIVQYMAEGNYFEVACRAAGVSGNCVRYWQDLHNQGHESAAYLANFFEALARASAVAEVNAVSKVSVGANGWQGPAWFIERRFPKRWNRKQRIDITSDGQPINGATFERIDNPRDEEIPSATKAEGVRKK